MGNPHPTPRDTRNTKDIQQSKAANYVFVRHLTTEGSQHPMNDSRGQDSLNGVSIQRSNLKFRQSVPRERSVDNSVPAKAITDRYLFAEDVATRRDQKGR